MIMNAAEIIKLVKKMRDAQNAYFKLRDGITLNEARQLEVKVDDAIAGYDNGQGNLFEGKQ